MSLLSNLRRHQEFYALLLAAALARLLFFFDYHEIWWDSGVYAGMAKYLWSGGNVGLWEHIRPVLWPLVIGIGWWLKLNLVWFARVIELVLSLVSVWLVYALGERWFSRRAGLVAGIVWAFSPIVFYLGFHEYTELPAVVLVLAGMYAASGRRWALAGAFAGLAFLMKFPAGIFIVVLGLSVLLQRQWRPLVPLGLGFSVPASAFLLFNHVMYGRMLGPLVDARESILGVLGCNVLRFKPWYQYLIWIFADNWLNVLALLGIGALAMRWKRQYALPLLGLLVPAVYFMQLHCREYRYLALFLPFAALLAGHGAVLVVEWLEKNKLFRRWAWAVALLAMFFVSAFHGVLFYHGNEARVPDVVAEKYYHWLEGKSVAGEVWTSNPVVSVYADVPVRMLYYPVFSEGSAVDFNSYLQENVGRIGVVLLDNCGGGIVCPPGDAGCERQLLGMREFLGRNFRTAFSAESGRCWYEVYEN